MVTTTFDVYNRSNPVSFPALKIIQRLLNETPDEQVAHPKVSESLPRPKLGPLPPMAPMAGLSATADETTAQLQRMAKQILGTDTPVIPSLYRHFTPWPQVLDLCEVTAGTLGETGALYSAAARMAAAADAGSGRLYRTCPVSTVTAPDEDARAGLDSLIENIPPMIDKITVVSLAVRRSLSL